MVRRPGRRLAVQSFTMVIERTVGFGIFFAVIFFLHLVSRLNIHWDEFFFLSHVHCFTRGEVLSALQTFHVHLFAWLTHLPLNEIGQIIVGRYCIAAVGMASGLMIYRISRLYLSRPGALFSALCYFSYASTFFYGAQFRADPLCLFLFLMALEIVLRRPALFLQAFAAGALLALAWMISIKSSFYVVTIVLIYGIRFLTGADKKHAAKEVFWFLVLWAGFVLLLSGWHRVLVAGPAACPAGSPGISIFFSLKSTFEKMFLDSPFFPRSKYFLLTVLRNPVTWCAMLFGIGLVLRDKSKIPAGTQDRRPLLALIFLPLTVLFYRNAWPYYDVFILPPLMIFSGMTMEDALSRYGKTLSRLSGTAAFVLAALVIATAGIHYEMHRSDGQKAQKEMVTLVHAVFPEPVFYIDRCSMIASYPKAGFFMSTWGMEEYRKTGVAVLARAVEDKHPVFLIANKMALDSELSLGMKKKARLLPEDEDTLRNNYIHHWGALWVAGKTVEFSAAGKKEFSIDIPGVYTLEANGPVMIDGEMFAPGSFVLLSAGTHVIKVDQAPVSISLRIGKNLYRPSVKPLTGPLFQGFY
ncbi:MAG TPA: hypothetical protein VLJ10_04695 [Candidatus Bathyarchaeia archaeon]|nr:hypothetical protein [Candidatus Bathyarchaeia archaeon]